MSRLWKSISNRERCAWVVIIVVALVATIAYQDLEGLVIFMVAVACRLAWAFVKRVVKG